MNQRTKTIVVILLLIFIYPIGLIFTWFWVSWPKRVKWLVSSPLLIALLGIVVILVLSTRSPNKALLDAENKESKL